MQRNDLKEAERLLTKSQQTLNKYFSNGDELNSDAVNMFFIELLRGNKSDAYAWLNKVVAYGFRDSMFLLNSPLTSDIHNEKQFEDMIQDIKNKVKKQQDILASMKN